MSSSTVLNRLTPQQRTHALEFVAARVVTSQDGEHLIWTGSTGGTARNPIIKFGPRTVMVRRWILDHYGFNVQDGDTITNTCQVQGCVLPIHLGNHQFTPPLYVPKNDISVKWYPR